MSAVIRFQKFLTKFFSHYYSLLTTITVRRDAESFSDNCDVQRSFFALHCKNILSIKNSLVNENRKMKGSLAKPCKKKLIWQQTGNVRVGFRHVEAVA